MKLPVCCLLAIALSSVMCAVLDQRILKLTEVMKELNLLNRGVQHNGLRLSTPTSDVEECCALKALSCFRENLQLLPAANKRHQHKLTKSLKSQMIVNSVNTCSQEETQNATCPRCDSFPKRDSREFVRELESLLQKTYSRLVERED
ncbi:interleukin-21 [Megalops cyprinoides]|uniref:interleukin-21 n=1 Tax=Megalops cyprinoides TaxID=118141 RepID=UPI001864EFAB|nr:interleukin-21 [Megalops cyprinoides]